MYVRFVVDYVDSKTQSRDCNTFYSYDVALIFARSLVDHGYTVTLEKIVVIEDWRD